MNPVSRNVILDLLPVYITGEASRESRALVEEFARQDPEIARLVRAGTLESGLDKDCATVPPNLEMKAIQRVRRSVRRKMVYVALATASILMIPLIAMQFSNEVNWSPADFLVMAILLSGTGIAFVLMTRAARSFARRAAIGLAVGTGFLLIWVNLAVGFIGSSSNPANLLYLSSFVVGGIGAWIARVRSAGMARTMLAVALVQFMIPFIALLLGTPALEAPPGVVVIVTLNSGFAAMFALSALLFWRASRT